MPFAFHYAARSDVGMVRSNNEDSGYAGPHLLAMADGMGGHAGGDVASSTVIGALVRLDGEALGGRDVSQALLDRIHRANAEIGDAGARRPAASTAWAPRSSRCCGPATRSSSRTSATRGRSWCATASSPRSPRTTPSCRTSSTRAGSPPTRRRPTRSAPSSPGCSPAPHDDEPDLVVRQGRIGDRYVICLRRPHRLRRARHHRRGPHDHRRPRRDAPTGWSPWRCAPARPTTSPSSSATSSTSTAGGPAHPAAGRRRRRRAAERAPGRSRPPRPPRPPRSPQQATGGDRPRRRRHPRRGGPAVPARHRAARWPPLLVVLAVVVAGGSYAAYAWSQQQYYLAERGRRGHRLPRGRPDPRPGRRSPRPSTPRRSPSTTCRPRTRPASSRASRSTTARPADARVADLRLQAHGLPVGPAQRRGLPHRAVDVDHPAGHPDARRPRRPRRPDGDVAEPSPSARAVAVDRLTGDAHEHRVVVHPAQGPQRRAGARHRGGRDRAARLPQRRARHVGHDPARHAHPRSAATSPWPSASTSCCAGAPRTPTR